MRSYRRYVTDQLGAQLLAVAKDGPRQLRATTGVLPREKETRGYTYMLDHTELPIWVVPNGYRRPNRPWMAPL